MSELKVNSIVDASSGNTVQINGQTPSESNMQGRNRIINGDMRIAQRGSGPFTASGSFAADRFQASNFTNSLFSAEQVTEAPAGFRNSLKITITTADANPTNNFQFRQRIEGFNVADLNFGAVSASPVTVSFWVRSSLTGNFGFSIRNSAGNRSYNELYAINAANTWEQKNITIPGDTTGTWLTTNGEGMQLTWSMGAPASSGTPNIWSTAGGVGTTGQVNVVSTLNATWQITGVQLEAGSVATPFERRPFGTELALCQRYFERMGGTRYEQIGFGAGISGTSTSISIHLKTEKRASPTFTITQDVIITPRHEYDTPVTGTGGVDINPRGMHARFDHADLGALYRPHFLLSKSATPFGYLDFNAEL